MPKVCKTILLADHSDGGMPPAASWLEKGGYSLIRSENIVDTLAMIAEKEPDLVVLSPSFEPMPLYEFEAVADALGNEQIFMLALHSLLKTDDDVMICARADDFYIGHSAEDLAARIRVMARRSKSLRNMTARLKRLEEESITDYKTELFNDRYILRRLQEEFDRSNRHRLVLSIIMLDFDEFKDINDTLGHAFGDFVLLSFAKKLKSLIRKIDIPGRLGGDEFLVILPNTDLDEAVRIADRVRSIVNSYKFEKDGVSARMTVSLGINAYGGDGSLAWEEFLKGADLGLLAAKSRGKNRIFLFPQLKTRENGLLLDENRKKTKRQETPASGKQTIMEAAQE
jgi:two-component system, cell cycle response regulator